MTHEVNIRYYDNAFCCNYQTKKIFKSGHANDASNIIFTTNHNDQNLFIRAPNILLIEDDDIIQKVIIHNVKLLGCKIDLGKDGFEAIELFQNAYDLILLDIGLPGRNGMQKSGIDVVKEIRHFEIETGTRRNTIIALTAFDATLSKKCLQAGCDDFYTKSILLDRLGVVLEYWLSPLANKSLKTPTNCIPD